MSGNVIWRMKIEDATVINFTPPSSLSHRGHEKLRGAKKQFRYLRQFFKSLADKLIWNSCDPNNFSAHLRKYLKSPSHMSQ